MGENELIKTKFGVVLGIFIFLYNPAISLLFVSLILFFSTNTNRFSWDILIILLSIYLGLINTTKLPESDLLAYLDGYNDVRYFDVLEYVLRKSKEPLFYLYTYLSFIVFNGSETMYILFSTFISYFFFMKAITAMLKCLNSPPYFIVFCLLFSASFYQLFGLSAHLIRQFMSGAILFYIIIYKVFYNKNNYLLLLASVFIHSTALFFIPFIYLPLFKARLSFKLAIKLLPIVGLSAYLFSYLIDNVAAVFGNNFITYAFVRLQKGVTYELEPLSTTSILFMILMLVMLLVSSVLIKNQEFIKSKWHFNNIYIILVILILGSLNSTELSLRYFFYIYFFSPLIICLLFEKHKKGLSLFFPFVNLLGILYFFYRIENGTWTYASTKDLLFSNLIGYFN